MDDPPTTLCDVLHTRPLALLPQALGARLGSLVKGSPEWEKAAAEAARTIPGRENGGNCGGRPAAAPPLAAAPRCAPGRRPAQPLRRRC